MKPEVFLTNSEEETIAVGQALAGGLPPCSIVLLVGDLGTGKTTLAKGIVEGLGVATAEDVSSPTFTLIHEYGEDRKAYHVDLYRLQSAKEAYSLGLEELFERDAVILVEWGERFPDLWPSGHFEVRLKWLGESSREIRVMPDRS